MYAFAINFVDWQVHVVVTTPCFENSSVVYNIFTCV